MARLILIVSLLASWFIGCVDPTPLDQPNPKASVEQGISTRLTQSGVEYLQETTKTWLQDHLGTEISLSWGDMTLDLLPFYPTLKASTVTVSWEDVSFSPPDDEGALEVVVVLGGFSWNTDIVLEEQASECEVTLDVPEATIAFRLTGSTDEAGIVIIEVVGVPSGHFDDDTTFGLVCDDSIPSIPESFSSEVISKMESLVAVEFADSAAPVFSPLFGQLVGASGLLHHQHTDGTAAKVAYQIKTQENPDAASLLSSTGEDLILSMTLGFESTSHPCVPPSPAAAAVQVEIPTTGTWLSGGTAAAHDFAFSIHRTTFEQALHHLYRAGFLCVKSPAGNTNSLEAQNAWDVLGSLKKFDGESRLRFHLQPLAPPTISFNNDGSTHPLSIHVFFPLLRFEIFAWIRETPIRLYEVRSSASLSLEPSIQEGGVLAFEVLDVHAGMSTTTSPLFDSPTLTDEAISELLLQSISDILDNRPLLLLGTPHLLPLEQMDARAATAEHALLYFSFPSTSPENDL